MVKTRQMAIYQSLFYLRSKSIPTKLASANTTIFMQTMVAPTGVEANIEMKIPTAEQITEITAEAKITARKLLKILIAERAGKIIKAEIKREPTKFIANTITEAVITAINKL